MLTMATTNFINLFIYLSGLMPQNTDTFPKATMLLFRIFSFCLTNNPQPKCIQLSVQNIKKSRIIPHQLVALMIQQSSW